MCKFKSGIILKNKCVVAHDHENNIRLAKENDAKIIYHKNEDER